MSEGWEVIRWIDVVVLAAKRLKWPAMLLFYLLFVRVFTLFGMIVLGSIAGMAVYAFFVDKRREALGADDFWGDKLFFRYGGEIEKIYFPIPVKPEWTGDDAERFTASLRQDLATKIKAHAPAAATQVIEALTILDQGTQQTKVFLRVLAHSPSGCLIAHFVHFAPFGNTIAAHYISYVRGRYNDWDITKFALASPFSIWLWGFPWLLNRCSLCSIVSHFTDSAFDVMDLETIFTTTRQLILGGTEEILKKSELLSDTVSQIINMYTTQNIKVSKSSGVAFSGFSQSPSVTNARVA